MSKLLKFTLSLNVNAKKNEPSVRIDDKLYWAKGKIMPLDVKKLKKVKSEFRNFGIYKTIDANLSPCFRDFFYEKEHYNYIGFDPKIGNIVISIAKNLSINKEDEEIEDKGTKKDFYYLLVRTNDIHYCAMGKVISSDENQGPNQIFKALLPNLEITADFKVFGNFMITEKLNQYDDLCIPLVINVGVLLQLKSQETEAKIFGNDIATPNLLEFLGCISDKIKLQGFKGYRGGLDVTKNLNGTIGYYVKIGRREIMFQVGPLLPCDQKDKENIARKKFIGNNLITIIFQEENTKFNPAWISSKFLQVFIIIQPKLFDGEIYYKVCIVAKKEDPKIKEILPVESYFFQGSRFKIFMHDLLFKSQEAALGSQNVLPIFNKAKKNLLETIAAIRINDLTFYSSCQHLNDKDGVKSTQSLPCESNKKPTLKSKILATIRSIKEHFNIKKKVAKHAKTTQLPKKKSIKDQKNDKRISQKHSTNDLIKNIVNFTSL